MMEIINQYLSYELMQTLLILIISIVAHTISGLGYAEAKNKFNYYLFIQGLKKSLIVFIVITLISVVGVMDNQIVIDGEPLITYMITAIKLIYIQYIAQASYKVLKIIQLKVGNENE